MMTRKVLQGRTCPHCGKDTELIPSEKIYGEDLGWMWFCKPCDAYVLCHEGSFRSKGTVANSYTRKKRKRAFKILDRLIEEKFIAKVIEIKPKREDKPKLREKLEADARKWIAKELGIEEEYAYISMMDAETAMKVFDICLPYYRKITG